VASLPDPICPTDVVVVVTTDSASSSAIQAELHSEISFFFTLLKLK
jgi:hypothetical protein